MGLFAQGFVAQFHISASPFLYIWGVVRFVFLACADSGNPFGWLASVNTSFSWLPAFLALWEVPAGRSSNRHFPGESEPRGNGWTISQAEDVPVRKASSDSSWSYFCKLESNTWAKCQNPATCQLFLKKKRERERDASCFVTRATLVSKERCQRGGNL